MHLIDRDKIFDRIICIVIAVLFVVSLIPVLYVCRYDFASGDDYAFGAAAHLTYRESHDIMAAVAASARHTADIYYSWQGTWMSVFVFGLHPEVFSDSAYVIVPWIMIGITVMALWYAAYHFIGKLAGISLVRTISAALLLMAAVIHFVPTKPNAYYWYNGAVHYTVPFAIMLFAVTDATIFLHTGRKAALIRTIVYFTVLGGMSYPAALAAPVGVILIYVYRITVTGGRPAKRDMLLLVPFVLETVGLAISAMAPGNRIRGGEEFGFSMSMVVRTVLMCFTESFRHAFCFITGQPFIVIIMIAVGICLYKIPIKNKSGFKNVPIIILMAVVWNASVYAPEIYSGVEVSEGVNNTYFMTLIISLSVATICCTCRIAQMVTERKSAGNDEQSTVPDTANGRHQSGPMLRRLIPWILVTLLVLLCRHSLSCSTFKVCTDFIKKGYGDDLRQQMLLQQELLNTEETVVTIPSTNGYDGPIMNMPVEESPDAWTNGAVARFYGKEAVYGMDADTWHSLYNQ